MNKFVSSNGKNLENQVKSDINLHFCNRITEHHEKEEKKIESQLQNILLKP